MVKSCPDPCQFSTSTPHPRGPCGPQMISEHTQYSAVRIERLSPGDSPVDVIISNVRCESAVTVGRELHSDLNRGQGGLDMRERRLCGRVIIESYPVFQASQILRGNNKCRQPLKRVSDKVPLTAHRNGTSSVLVAVMQGSSYKACSEQGAALAAVELLAESPQKIAVPPRTMVAWSFIAPLPLACATQGQE